MNFISNPDHFLRSKREATRTDHFYAIEVFQKQKGGAFLWPVTIITAVFLVLGWFA